jgi:precorrin-2/cobalt-factor-2 C20-methyltransferase
VTGKVYGLGLGPGDSELVTVKAARLIGSAPVVAYPRTQHGDSFVRDIAAPYVRQGATELPLDTPMAIDTAIAQAKYDEHAELISAHLEAGRDVVLLCEGDPFVYGSFMYLYDRLADRYEVEVIPGVSSITACAAAAGLPLAGREDILTILPATLPEDILERELAQTSAAVVMKIGRHLDKVRRVIDRIGATGGATYVERALTPSQRVVPLARFTDAEAPYFSVILVFRDTD